MFDANEYKNRIWDALIIHDKRNMPKPKRVHKPHDPQNPLEHTEMTLLAEYLDLVVGEYGWCHPANEGRRSERAGHILKTQGMKPGIPDVLVFKPLIAIELKRRHGGRSSPEQIEWIARFAEMGWKAKICAGFDVAKQFLASCGVGA